MNRVYKVQCILLQQSDDLSHTYLDLKDLRLDRYIILQLSFTVFRISV